MTTVTESDLKELKDLINNLSDKIEERFDKLEERTHKIEITTAKIESKLDGLEKRVDDINGRLNIMTIGFLSIVGVLVAGMLGFVGKVVFFSNQP